MSFLDIFDETRRKIGGAIGNQVDNFRVGLNLKQPKNMSLSLAQDALKLQSARRVLGREGIGSAAGVREAGKGILRTAVTGLDTARKLQPGYYVQPQRSKIQQNQFRDNMLKRLAPRGNEVQKALNKGFEFSSQMASYGPIEGATLKVASKVAPRLLASKGGQFVTRRVADVLGGQAMASQQDIKNAGGGIKGRAVIAGMDILGGSAMEGAGRIAKPIAKVTGQKINLARGASKMGKELPSRVKVGENAFSYNRGGRTIEVPNEVAEFYIKNGRMPTKNDILPKNYKFKGTTELRFQDGKFHGWDSDNDLFKAKIAQDSPSIGLSTKDISGKSDALSNEAKTLYTGRGGKITDFSKTKSGELFFSENPKVAEYYGGTMDNVTGAKVDTSDFIDLSSPQKIKQYVKENFTKEDVDKLFPDNTYRNGRNSVTGETEQQFINRQLNDLQNSKFTGGEKQKLLLDKIKSQGHSGAIIEDNAMAEKGIVNDKSYVVFDKSKVSPQSTPSALSNEARKMATDKRGLKLKNPYGGDLPTNPDGTITVYHSTTPESAQKIAQEGIRGSKVEGGNIYFTTDPKGYSNIGKGKSEVLKFNVDPSKVEFDDVYRGTLHLKSNNADIQGLKPLSPQSTQGAPAIKQKAPDDIINTIYEAIDAGDESAARGIHKSLSSEYDLPDIDKIIKDVNDYKTGVLKSIDGDIVEIRDTPNTEIKIIADKLARHFTAPRSLFKITGAKRTYQTPVGNLTVGGDTRAALDNLFYSQDINSFGKNMEMMSRKFGGVFSEIYEGIKRGDIDGADYEQFTRRLNEQLSKRPNYKPRPRTADEISAIKTKFAENQTSGSIVNSKTTGGVTPTTPLKATNTEKGISSSTQGATPKIKLTEKPQLNTSKFNISEQAKTKLDETVAAIKPELEQVKGATLKNEEVVDAAKASKILSREVNPEATKKATAAVTRLRQEVAAGAEGKGLTKDFIENLKVLKSYSADAGRKLQAFNIKASPETSIKESIIADLVGLGKKSDDLIKAAKGVDFDNPKQVSKFYRQFVKPSLGEVLDEYRYINLLSSPQTHIVNAFSNLIQGTVLNPATKLYTGAIDSIGSTLTGKQRTAYMREVPAYSKGFINSMGEAFKEASEVMKGNKFVERPDINRLSTGKLGPGEYVMRALEAGDVFFRKMIKGGEMEALAYKASRSGKKIPKSVMEKQAADAAEYFVFRKAPDPTNKTGQGAVLSGIDKATEAVYKFRNVPGVKWVIPFVQTPMNILKQGLEYSPLGVSTMVGNTNKTQQLAKALIGSTVLAGAATLESTWDAPTSKNEKEEFYASGRKPYSVKMGDNWVSYSKLGPLAYPMAMAAAVKWYFENDPKATSTDSIDKMTKMLGGIAGFFADQSYLSGIGDLVDVAKGEDYAIKGMLANFGKQLVPLTSLQGWVARQLDPIYRQPKTITEQIKTGIPGLSKSVESYKDPLGNDSVRQNNTFNSWSPVNVNPANQQFEDIYQKRQLQKRSDAEAKALTSGSKTLSDGRVAVVINDEVKKFDSQQEADQAINKEKFKNSDKKAELIDGTYYYKKSDGDVGTYTEQEYNYKLRNAKMDIAYNKKDYKGWVQLANEKLKDIEKQYNEADPLTQQELLNDYQDLAAKIAKYSGYGGFTKGKAGKKFGGITLPTATAKIPIRQAKAPAFKNISKTPRIAIKTNKPKMISKSTLANMR